MSGSKLMSPAAAPPTPGVGQGLGGDPSMEDILASIRRILAEDDAPPDAVAGKPAKSDNDILVLDETMMVKAARSTQAEPISPEPEPEAEPEAEAGTEAEAGAEPVAAAAEAAEPEPQAAPHAAPGAGAPTEGLLALETADAATHSVSSLLRALTADRSMLVNMGGPTVEDIVRETVRPLLKEWLDAHLPDLVERLVRAEIERVVSRAA